MKKNTTHQIIADRMIAALEKGDIVWDAPYVRACNIKTKRQYSGINVLLTSITAMARGFTSPYFGTVNNILELGGRVKPEEWKKYTIAVWCDTKLKNKENEDDEDEYIWFYKWYKLYNLDQTTLPKEEFIFENIEADSVYGSYPEKKPKLTNGAIIPCYAPKKDEVRMPGDSSFDNMEAKYATLFHELVHSTGHDDRLDRELTASKMADSYSFEELVAEIGASFLCADTGIDNKKTRENADAYVKHWVSMFKDKPSMIARAAARAQDATDYILQRGNYAIKETQAA